MADQPRSEPAADWIHAPGVEGRTVPAFVLAKWAWYRKASGRQRWRYMVMEVLGILCAASVPVAVSMRLTSSVIAVLGAAVVVVSGTRVLFGSHENWVEFSQTRYGIEREMAFYLSGVEPYDEDAGHGVRLLVARVEDLSASGGQRWAARRTAAAELPVTTQES